MKKIFLIIVLFLATNVHASEMLEVTLNKCVDGDTAWFNLGNEEIKARFLAIDTPESTTTKEEFGEEASIFVCNKLEEANKIEVQYDPDSDKLDKYDRHLVWVFVDNQNLQELTIKEGFGEVEYLYGDYLYTSDLEVAEKYAKDNQLNIWSEYESTPIYFYIIGGVILIVIILLFLKIKNKVSSEINKERNKI